MRLGLSSEAAPDASVEELVATCARRGLSALELTLGADIEPDRVLRHVHDAQDAAVQVSGFLSAAAGYAHQLSALSRRAAAPIVVNGSSGLRGRLTFARSIAEHGGRALALVQGPADRWLDPVLDAGLGFAWQVDDTCSDPAGDAELILREAGSIEYVRLVGGGPEAALQEGRGVGALVRCLTLSGYTGPLILTPSSRRYRLAWAAWLGRRGGWGCGTRAGHAERATIPIHL
jgi:hypothetical protein